METGVTFKFGLTNSCDDKVEWGGSNRAYAGPHTCSHFINIIKWKTEVDNDFASFPLSSSYFIISALSA